MGKRLEDSTPDDSTTYLPDGFLTNTPEWRRVYRNVERDRFFGQVWGREKERNRSQASSADTQPIRAAIRRRLAAESKEK